MRFFVVLAALFALTSPLSAAEAGALYRVESAVWCSGDLRGQPRLDLSPGASESFEIDAGDERWRLRVEVEPPSEHEGAAPGSVWLKVDIEQWVDGGWQFLTDTMIGTPLGEPGRITVVGESEAESTPELAPLYVEMVTSRIDAGN